jgi:hypothetical protein
MTYIGASLDVPTGCHSDVFKSFIDLLRNATNCTAVDLKNELWFHSSVCNTEVKGRPDCPFTIVQWNEHIKPGSAHCKKLEQVDSIAMIREKSKSGKVSTSISSCNQANSIFTCSFTLDIEQNRDALLKTGRMKPDKSILFLQ